MEYNKKLERIVSYIKSGETSPSEYKLGMEMEHFIVDKDTLESIDYFGDRGVGESLETLSKRGFEIINQENNQILGLKKNECEITIEPAGQFEVSIDGKYLISDIKKTYEKVMQEINPVFEEKNQLMVTLGYHPKSKIEDLRLIPKDRYKYMAKYFEKFGGSMALNMMKGTASLQTAVDYKDEEDFKVKFFVANALSIFLYSLFDNSHIFEGEVYKARNLRQKIWENCDKNRTGVYEFAFDDDFSYEKYARKILDTDIIFIHENNEDVYKANTKFSEIMDYDSSDDMIFHALSIVFPDVRIKKYIEIRMPDEVPAPYNFSFLALIKGLFYNQENLLKMKELLSSMTYEKYLKLRDESYSKGIFAEYESKTIIDWILEFIEIAKSGLDGEEEFLEPIIELMNVKRTLRHKFEILYKQDPKNAVYRFSVGHYLEKVNK